MKRSARVVGMPTLCILLLSLASFFFSLENVLFGNVSALKLAKPVVRSELGLQNEFAVCGQSAICYVIIVVMFLRLLTLSALRILKNIARIDGPVYRHEK